MIVSEKPNRSNWRWLQACVLLCAMVVLPLGIASAQDYEAVEKRLGEAVSKGELTLEHAGLMMDALKKEAAKKGTKKITREDLARAAIEIRKAVADGKISAEDGRTKLAGMRKMMAEQGQRQRGGERRRITREGYARAAADLRKAVAERKISEGDLRARLNGMRRAMADQGKRGSRRITREDYARAEADLKKAVAEGKISGKDLRARLNGMRRAMADQGERQRGGERQRTTRGDKRAEYEGFEQRIKAAVAEGKMTREEAGEKIEGYKKRMAMAERRGNEHAELDAYLKGVWKRLQVGVKEGKLSEEEAKAKMAAIKIEAYEKAEAGEQGERRRRR